MRLGRSLQKRSADSAFFTDLVQGAGNRLLDAGGAMGEAHQQQAQTSWHGTAPGQGSLRIRSPDVMNPAGAQHRTGARYATPSPHQITMRDAVTSGLRAVLGPFAPFVMPRAKPYLDRVSDQRVTPGRAVNTAYTQEAQRQNQAIRDLGVGEIRNSIAADVRRVVSMFAGEEHAERASSMVMGAGDPFIQSIAPFAQQATQALPGWFSETADAADYARIARHVVGGPPSADHIQATRDRFDEMFSSGAFGEDFAGDRAGALSIATTAVETDRSGNFDPERIARFARAANTLTQTSGQTVSHAAAANILRYSGQAGLTDDPAALTALGEDLGRMLQSGRVSSQQLTEAAQMQGMHGVRNLLLVGDVAGSSLLTDETRGTVTNELSHAAEAARNNPLARALLAVNQAGTKRERQQAAKIVQQLNAAGDQRAQQQALQQANGFVRSVRGNGRLFPTFATGYIEGMPDPLRQLNTNAYEALIYEDGSRRAQQQGATSIQRALSGDRQALKQFHRWMESGMQDQGGGFDRGSQVALQDPRTRAMLVGAVHQYARREGKAQQRGDQLLGDRPAQPPAPAQPPVQPQETKTPTRYTLPPPPSQPLAAIDTTKPIAPAA